MAFFLDVLGGEDFAGISEDKSATRIGKRIKKIRETREMTRAELGALVGLDQNRVQQYENGRRKPKIKMLNKFADALGVKTFALLDPIIDTYVGAMHTLFQMEEKFDLKVVKKDDCYCLQFGDGRFGGMNSCLKDWYKIRQELDEAMPELTVEKRKKKVIEYNMFEWTYPSNRMAGIL